MTRYGNRGTFNQSGISLRALFSYCSKEKVIDCMNTPLSRANAVKDAGTSILSFRMMIRDGVYCSISHSITNYTTMNKTKT